MTDQEHEKVEAWLKEGEALFKSGPLTFVLGFLIGRWIGRCPLYRK